MMALYASATFPPFFLATFWQKFPFKKNVSYSRSLAFRDQGQLLTTMQGRRRLSKLGEDKPNYVVRAATPP